MSRPVEYFLSFCRQLEDGSIARHAGERKVRTIDDDASSVSLASEAEASLTLDEVDEEPDDDDALSQDSGSDEKDDVHSDGDRKAAGGDDGGGDEDQDDGDEGDEEKDGSGKDEGAGGDSSGEKSSSSCAVEFPDTSINLTHVKGDK